MKKTLAILSITFLLVACGSSTKVSNINDLASSNPIEAFIDLTNVTDDKVPVIINPGRITQDNVTFRLPKVVQGTYTVSNFGNYIDGLKAFDYNGVEIPVTKLDDNSWTVNNATQLDKLTYWVNDTFDQEIVGGIGQKVPFSPAGTNIEADNFVLNLHGFVGYFDSLKNNQYKLDVTAPATFVRASALQETAVKSGPDGTTITTSYFAPRYFDVTDNPMMYGKLDVEEFMVGDVKIVLNVYSPNKIHAASSIKDAMYKMMKAQKEYLGDINTTSRYDIYLFLSTMEEGSPKGFGALEHHTSTVVVFPEDTPIEALTKSMTDVVSHEFFHIVSPLSIHSEDVHYFDYNNPSFSKHLWMYEGVTEYFANLFQINKELITDDEFFERMINKIKMASVMNDAMSFTVMSENVLNEPYSRNYLNVYQKGALIGMCLDILIREESNGNRGILSVMKELSLKYGKNKPFEDDKLIDEITVMTYPSIGDFFEDHVIGTTPIDYDKFFEKVGLTIVKSKVKTNYIQNDGGFIFAPNMETGTIAFTEMVKNNSFWNDQGAKAGDDIVEVNGVKLTFQNAQQVFTEMYMWQPGKNINVKLNRSGEAVVIKAETTQSYTNGLKLGISDTATEKQTELRNAWLKG